LPKKVTGKTKTGLTESSKGAVNNLLTRENKVYYMSRSRNKKSRRRFGLRDKKKSLL
jgi:hypothetical protein